MTIIQPFLITFSLPLSSRLQSFVGIIGFSLYVYFLVCILTYTILPSSLPPSQAPSLNPRYYCCSSIHTYPSFPLPPPPSHFLPSIIPYVRKSRHCFMCPCHCPAGNASMYHNSFHIFCARKNSSTFRVYLSLQLHCEYVKKNMAGMMILFS